MYWGPAATPDAELPEITLTHTGFRDFVSSSIGGHVVGQHRYTIFAPGSLAPGEYRWRYEDEHPFFGFFVARGLVTVIDG